MKIIRLRYDWFAEAYGDEYKEVNIGQHGVVEIIEHQALGDGDKWRYDIVHEDGSIETTFNPNNVLKIKVE